MSHATGPALRANNHRPMRRQRRARDRRSLRRLVGSTCERRAVTRLTLLGQSFYSSNAASTHNQNLPSLLGMTAQQPHSSPHMSAQRPPSASEQGLQGPPYSLPGISQTLQQQQQQQPHMPSSEQASADRERELREREMMESHILQQHAAQQEEHIKREAEQRDREHHERQQREQQAAHQSHSGPIQIHQPVAVAPSTRTVHGPNGLLGQVGGPNVLGAPMAATTATPHMYGAASAQHEQTTPRMQHAVQPAAPPQMMLPGFAPPGSMNPMGPMGQGGQQPILNVSLGTPAHVVAHG